MQQNEHRHITLLAPAKDLEVGKCAIQAGADAVYIGAPMFSARQMANNDLDSIAQLVQYAHQYNAQVYVALNTLLNTEEQKKAVDICWQLHERQVDAIIMQDLRLLQYPLPPIRLHASTQCDNRTIEQVKRLQEYGFQRAVLARELSLEEIKAIREAVPDIELEVFVHGALCVCYSGKCYMSERLLGRSANRGECAQMCRMKYDLLDENQQEITDEIGEKIHQRYVLSLKDLDRSAFLQSLMDIGVDCFKIEGRLKNKEYVTNVVAYYRQLLAKQNEHRYFYTFTPSPKKTFHRDQTDYFLQQRNQPMANWNTPKSTGEPIGKVINWDKTAIICELSPQVTLQAGDGLCYLDSGFAVNKIEPITPKQARITPNVPINTLQNLQVNMPLFRNYDKAFMENLKADRKIPLSIEVYNEQNNIIIVAGSTKQMYENTFTTAQNADLALQNIKNQFSKLNNTIFCLENIHIALSPIPFVPIATLNQWRREVIEQETQRQTYQPKHTFEHPIQKIDIDYEAKSEPLMTCKYCILYEMGHCRKKNPFPKHQEPRFLRLQTGRMMRLEFDCEACQMKIWEK